MTEEQMDFYPGWRDDVGDDIALPRGGVVAEGGDFWTDVCRGIDSGIRVAKFEAERVEKELAARLREVVPMVVRAAWRCLPEGERLERAKRLHTSSVEWSAMTREEKQVVGQNEWRQRDEIDERVRLAREQELLRVSETARIVAGLKEEFPQWAKNIRLSAIKSEFIICGKKAAWALRAILMERGFGGYHKKNNDYAVYKKERSDDIGTS